MNRQIARFLCQATGHRMGEWQYVREITIRQQAKSVWFRTCERECYLPGAFESRTEYGLRKPGSPSA